MHEQAATLDPSGGATLFNDVQRILAENLPVLYFAAPRLYYAHSRAPDGRRAVGDAAAGAVERRFAQRDRSVTDTPAVTLSLDGALPHPARLLSRSSCSSAPRRPRCF